MKKNSGYANENGNEGAKKIIDADRRKIERKLRWRE